MLCLLGDKEAMTKQDKGFRSKIDEIVYMVQLGSDGHEVATDRIVSLVRELVEGELYLNPGTDPEANASNESINNILSKLGEPNDGE